MGDTSTSDGHGRVVVTLGTSVLTGLSAHLAAGPAPADDAARRLREGRLKLLKHLHNGRGITEEWVEELFPGFPFTGGPGSNADFDALVDDFGADPARRSTVPDLRALDALAGSGVGARRVTYLAAAEPANHFAARAIERLAELHRWQADVQQLPTVGRSMTDAQKAEAVEHLVQTLRFDPDSIVPPHIVVAGGMKVLSVLAAMLGDRAGLDVSILMGTGDENWLLPITRVAEGRAHGVESIVPSVMESLADWDAYPAEVQLALVGRGSKVSEPARQRMAKRTRAWVEHDVWQADRLIQMAHHGVRHGRRVDRLATLMLRAAPMLDRLAGAEADAAFESLSAAAWLHDIGHRGGMFDGTYLHDHEHVRLFHGVLSKVVIDDHPEELELQDRPVRYLTGMLAQRHQRMALLHDEPVPKGKVCKAEARAKASAGGPDPTAHCPVCPGAVEAIQAVSLHDELTADRAAGNAAPVHPDVAVRLAAILRLADAIDIGAHRVDGRWGTTSGTRSIEQVWRRDVVASIMRDAEIRGDHEVVATIRPLLEATEWTLPVRTLALRRLESVGSANARSAAQQIEEFDDYVRSQAGHVALHRVFHGADIVDTGAGGLVVRMLPNAEWLGLEPAIQDDRFAEAADYVWGEFWDSVQFLDDPSVARLREVRGPDGRSIGRDEASDRRKAEERRKG